MPDLNLTDFGVANEPILGYAKNSKERIELEKSLKQLSETCQDIPIVIGSEEIRTKDVQKQVYPHDHAKKLATFYYADKKLLQKAISTSVEAQKKWDRTSIEERLRIWDRAADLMAGQYRQTLNAATMLGQAKTVIQAEIDSSAELIDFIR